MKKWETFTDEELELLVKNSRSIRDLAIKLGYNPDGGSGIKIVKEMLNLKQFDISHFLGQGWNKNNFNYSRFQYGNNIKVADALSALIALRGRKCERCNLSNWQNEPIPLEIHHIDGNHLNNTIENLQILCCNCHALTKNFRGRNQNNIKQRAENISDEKFIKALQSTPNVRQALLKLGLTACGGNYERAYNLINQYQIKQN